jgi:D-alanyl-D-alanine dipeptidase
MRFNFILLIHLLLSSWSFSQGSLPPGFVDVKEHIPNIVVDLRYYSDYNFVGDTIDGYKSQRLILSERATKQLVQVQKELNSQGLGLKVFDGYRPQTAVNHFVKWAKVLNDTLMKSKFYPEVEKTQLFSEGYIASRSGHTRGSTVDLTIIELKTKKELDMGSPFDFFGPVSWVRHENLSTFQRFNRELLQQVMKKHGFRAYDKEWWHFTVNNEPFPNTYFNFPVD